jgi:hypothetical protein
MEFDPHCNFLRLHLVTKHGKAGERQEFGEGVGRVDFLLSREEWLHERGMASQEKGIECQS